jgi:hypothetical protein
MYTVLMFEHLSVFSYFVFITFKYLTDEDGVNASGLRAVGAWFGSRPGHRLPWQDFRGQSGPMPRW